MERESFEDEKTVESLNAHFVSIKVDREEPPDVDKIYMTAVQAMGEGGGWPLNAFLTPDRKPFYGGTYFPPEPKFGRPSFRQLLEHIVRLWETRGNDVLQSRSEEHMSELQSPCKLVCRLLLDKKNLLAKLLLSSLDFLALQPLQFQCEHHHVLLLEANL